MATLGNSAWFDPMAGTGQAAAPNVSVRMAGHTGIPTQTKRLGSTS